MKANERNEMDYRQGHTDGSTFRERKLAKPAWYSPRKQGGGHANQHYGLGFQDGVEGRPHRYNRGLRKRALV